MKDLNIYKKLPAALLPWYQIHKRDLPWRADKDPYHIWVSEIMLQQTRVEAVKGYYARFLSAFPSIHALANADDTLLHKLWEGLGYYSRVRNLKKAAQIIVEQHNGMFPVRYNDILALPGIGAYTAGAICSIAFGYPTPAVDGNVLRVISRLTNDRTPIDTASYKKAVYVALAEIYPQEAGEFTQALMELGATVCGPNHKPMCNDCPCNQFCLAYKNGTTNDLPAKSLKRLRRVEKKTVFILSCDGEYALEKRPEKGLLAGLWQFPNISGKLNLNESINWVEETGLKLKDVLRKVERKHIFTHIEWDMSGVYLEVTNTNDQYTWLSVETIRSEIALPTAFRQFWEEIGSI